MQSTARGYIRAEGGRDGCIMAELFIMVSSTINIRNSAVKIAEKKNHGIDCSFKLVHMNLHTYCTYL